MGYSVGKWLKDNKIDHISIWCDKKNLDIFECFFTSLLIEESIEIVGCYSYQDFECKFPQSINFGYAYFRGKTPPSEYPIVYVDDGLTDKAQLHSLAKSHKVYRLIEALWQALAYATVYRPIVEFKNLNPSVNILCVNFPSMPPQERRDDREQFMCQHVSDYWVENLVKKLPESFNVFEKEYSAQEWIDLFVTPKSEIVLGRARHYLDFQSKLINIQDGHRITKFQPDNYTKTIYMLGGCGTFGYGNSDEDTCASKLQALLISNGIDYIVQNYGSFLNYRRKDMYDFLFNLPVKDGDVIIVEVWSKLPQICQDYFDFLNLKELFFRPHKYGDVFIDADHFSYIGQAVLAQQMFEHIKGKNYYESAPLFSPKINIEPTKIFGIPNNILYTRANRLPAIPALETYLNGIAQHKAKIGAIVMNCNPFTLGHQYLIETAAMQCDKLYVFVVQEDKSFFKFADRLELVKQGTAHLANVCVLPSGEFMISSLTFNDYFNKSKLQDKIIDSSKDVCIFAEDIAPALGINIRFAGEEPIDMVTKQYNETMRKILPQYGIAFLEIKRRSFGGDVISASLVRELLAKKEFKKIKKLVPQTTYHFLLGKYK